MGYIDLHIWIRPNDCVEIWATEHSICFVGKYPFGSVHFYVGELAAKELRRLAKQFSKAVEDHIQRWKKE